MLTSFLLQAINIKYEVDTRVIWHIKPVSHGSNLFQDLKRPIKTQKELQISAHGD